MLYENTHSPYPCKSKANCPVIVEKTAGRSETAYENTQFLYPCKRKTNCTVILKKQAEAGLWQKVA